MILLLLGASLGILIAIVLALGRRSPPEVDEASDDLIALDIATDGELDGRLDDD